MPRHATQRLLITGGSGYLGAELVRQARAHGGWDLMATYASRQPDDQHASYLPLDLRDRQALERVFDQARPDVVVHTAFVQGGVDLWAVTADGAGAVARAARSAGARLIHVSSDALFDGEAGRAYTEADPPSPITPYGAAKAAAEQQVATHDPNALIVRTSLIYGGDGSSKHEQLVLDAADGRAEIAFFVDEIRCPIQVGDLARALLELARGDQRGVLNVAGADAVSRYEFAVLIAQAAGRASAALQWSHSAGSQPRRPRNCPLDTRLARRLLGTRLRGAREVLGAAG